MRLSLQKDNNGREHATSQNNTFIVLSVIETKEGEMTVRWCAGVSLNQAALLCHDHTHNYALKMERETLGHSFLPSVTSQTHLREFAEVGDQSGFSHVTPFSFQPVILVMFRVLNPNFQPQEC